MSAGCVYFMNKHANDLRSRLPEKQMQLKAVHIKQVLSSVATATTAAPVPAA